MSISVEQLEEWIREPENENLEFKKAENQYSKEHLFEYCVAIANEGGGKLILGVSDKMPRQVFGTQAFQNVGDIKNKIFEKLHFRVQVCVLLHKKGRVLVFDIPSRPKGTPLQLDGRYLMRVGESMSSMSPDQLKKIISEGDDDFLLQVAKTGLSGDDIINLLDTQIFYNLLETPYPKTREGVLEKFINEKLIRSKKKDTVFEITNLGAVLFARDLRNFESVERKAPRIIVYTGKNKLSTRSDVSLNKGFVVGFESLIDYVNDKTNPNEIIGKAFRENVKMFPEIAIRELVANALIHQDFNETGTSTVVEIYSDRIEISNPGKPFISPERFIDEYQSRNEKLADIMRRLRICEEKGSGIDKVIHSIEAWQLPAPDFRSGEHQTKAIVFSNIPFENMERKDKVRACYQHCCLKYVMNEKMSNETLRERFNLVEIKSYHVSRVIQDTLKLERIKLDDPESTSKRYSRYVPYWA
jgi:ATP-dependent DNA helicase RecG